MSQIVFFDAEISPHDGKILDVGAVAFDGPLRSGGANSGNAKFHSKSVREFEEFLRKSGAGFVAGHNVVLHDLKFLGAAVARAGAELNANAIDTLFLSPLLFPKKPYHRLVKDEKLQKDELNNPLSDALKANELFDDEAEAWEALPRELRTIFFSLLSSLPGFCGFFRAVEFGSAAAAPQALEPPELAALIKSFFAGKICASAKLKLRMSESPAALAYCLALVNAADDDLSTLPPWVLRSHPQASNIMRQLRSKPCPQGCEWCRGRLDPRAGLKRFFGFDSFRSYAGEPLQENAARAAVEGKSLLAVFPTGGGKSVSFQVPALMAGENERGLTVVISPLQSLMKDQVDNLESKGITRAVAISGLLDPIERAKAIERVADGSASLLYIAPESLRSATIENLLLARSVARFVVDEAHCFSSWGQDFRPDYLYIGRFIKELQERKPDGGSIPVSCFTATAKQRVKEDICEYFRRELGLELEVFSASSRRENLHFVVLEKKGEEEKYIALRELLATRECPSIVYASRTRRVEELARRLSADGIEALPFHGQMDKAAKAANQDAFMSGAVRVMVATTAFGMGVDKKDVGLVAHFDISDSLENYTQEAGRAGRDENIEADCVALFDEDDLDKHFLLLNQTKITVKEIQDIWSAVKRLTKSRKTIQNSALEIARAAGWSDEAEREIGTRVTTAITALEESKHLERGQNSPRLYASSIACASMALAASIIESSPHFSDPQSRIDARRIMASLLSPATLKWSPAPREASPSPRSSSSAKPRSPAQPRS